MTGLLSSAASSRPNDLRRQILSSAARPLGWLLLAVVLVVALVLGSVHTSAPTRAERIAGLEAVLKCPSCADESIAQSDAAAAIDLRSEVTSLVDQGRSTAAIEKVVVAQYGSDELLSPPTSGLGALVWIVPLVALVVAASVLGLFLLRRRRSGEDASGPDSDDEALVVAALRTRSPS